MEIRPAADRRAWEDFLTSAHPPTFLQCWAWGETQRAGGEDVHRLAAVENGATVGVCQAVTVTARRGSFLHVPHGPLVLGSGQGPAGGSKAAVILLDAMRKEAKRRKLAFLRVSPIQGDTEESRALYWQLGFRRAPIHLHAERLWVLDLAPTKDRLRATMRKTTRNLLRRAERADVRVRLAPSDDALRDFLALYAVTARRERFVPYRPAVIQSELQAFAATNSASIVTAHYGSETLAAALIIFTEWSAFYHHGASSRAHPQVPASTLLHWAVICEAQRRGCSEYNFWGISPRKSNHPWAGITLFKTGFGGREVPLVPTQDLPLSSRYWPAYTLDTFRRWKRGV